MSIDFNHVKEFHIGDTNIKSISIGGSTIWTGFVFDPTKMSYTEDEFIDVVNNGYAGQLPLNAVINLTNARCGQYKVIGTNHDDTENTVDIMSMTQLNNMYFHSSTSGNVYKDSAMRTWLVDTFFYMFSADIQNLSKTMNVSTYTGNTSDKVKLPSLTEIGGNYFSFYAGNEGNRYPVFPLKNDNKCIDALIPAGSYGNSTRYALRTIQKNTNSICYEDSSGQVKDGSAAGTYAYGAVAILRF